jgi:drug/metabolite transporter (DMT)-like permease
MTDTAAPPSLLARYGTPITLTLVALIWGGTFIAGRQLAGHSPPLLSAFLRFLSASVVLGLYQWQHHSSLPRLSGPQIRRVLLLGLFGIFFYNICFFYGLQIITASRASLIVAMNPAMIALTTFIFIGEKPTPIKILGIVCCLIGACSIILSKDPTALVSGATTWQGDLLIFGCVISWVTYSVFSKKLIGEIGALTSVFFSLTCGTIMLFFAALLHGDLTLANLAQLGWPQAGSLLFLGVLGSALAYVWYYQGIDRIGATRAGVYIALVPMFAVLLGALLLKEPVTLTMIGGGALAISGIMLCNRQTPVAK